MTYEKLRETVFAANIALASSPLVLLTWGNVSGVDRSAGVLAIKPSGVGSDTLTAADIPVVSLETGLVVDGDLCPSSDTPTHLALYRAFDSIGGIAHSHSVYATSWAQSGREIPCLGTTHADFAYGNVPLTRWLSGEEIRNAYEENTGRIVVECLEAASRTPDDAPAVLVAGHGPFTWGASPQKAFENALTLEVVAEMAYRTLALKSDTPPLPQPLLDKHFLRKHGPDAYYGQQK